MSGPGLTSVFNLSMTVLAFLVALGSLVIIHELGHYLLARWCGVKVLRFSVGMGKVIFSRRFGRDQTEWAISVLPLGGYVKMLDARGQDLSNLPASELAREFTRQNVWRRIAIVAAGPLANFLLAIALFAGVYMHGMMEPSNRIRVAQSTSPAAHAGLRSGDAIIAVNHQASALWSDLQLHMLRAGLDKHGATLQVERPGHGRLEAQLPAASFAGLDADGDLMRKLGLDMARPPARLGTIIAGGAAARAGLLAQDVIERVDGAAVSDGPALIDLIRVSAGKTLLIEGQRAGRAFQTSLKPETELSAGAPVGKIKAEVNMAPELVRVTATPVGAVVKASMKVWDTGSMTLTMLGQMVTGQASWKNVTGPITIADYAGQTARVGLISYLSFLAFISISLGVMNLLPIPVLDGGFLLYYSLEVLTGRPVSERFGQIAQRFGMGLLLGLMALAFFNDVARLLS